MAHPTNRLIQRKARDVRFHLALSFLLSLVCMPQFGTAFSNKNGFRSGTWTSSYVGSSSFDRRPSSPLSSSPLSTTSRIRRRMSQWQTRSCLFSSPPKNNSANNGNSGGNKTVRNGGKTLYAKQILFPEIYLSGISHPPLLTDDDAIPLFAAIQSLIQSLDKIIAASSSFAASDEMTEEQTALLTHLDGTTILRIEQPISAVRSVDPLCWLHAQKTSLQNLRRKLSGEALPVIYFGDAEGHVEAAVIGKVSPSYSDSWDPFVGKRIWDHYEDDEVGDLGERFGNDLGRGEAQRHSMFKESDLPPRARVYGGSRFDWKFYQEKMKNRQSQGQRQERNGDDSLIQNSNIDSDDWDGFGGIRGGYWILPAVELRREVLDTSASSDGNPANDHGSSGNGGTRTLTLAIHLHNLAPLRPLDQKQLRLYTHRMGWRDAAKRLLSILQELSDQLSPPVPCTTLPPVLTRSESTGKRGESGSGDGDPGYIFERGVTEALRLISKNSTAEYGTTPLDHSMQDDQNRSLRKVVLARKVDLHLGSSVSGLDILMKLKFGGHIGHIFYLNPGTDEAADNLQERDGMICSREFLGCTPERLFRVKGQDGIRTVTSEALAGTRIRGLTPSADAELLRELLSSEKDMLENEITGKFISDALNELEDKGWLQKRDSNSLLRRYEFNGNSFDKRQISESTHKRRFFVRRLRHLQHICQTFEERLSDNANVIDVSRSLLSALHPTPAVCGDSADIAMDFIRQFETLASYDRGYYAGPFGYVGHDSADIVVAIRSALVTNFQIKPNSQSHLATDDKHVSYELPESRVSVFAGAGVVKGSTVQGEWTETSHKLGVISSLFPSSPVTLQSYSSPNVAWSSAFIEELVRCGVTTFYICPGSRNTPLTASIFKATRTNVGIVRAISVHDERGAGFRALGYARQNGRPAAVVTSSGTAVANLYPSVVEASSDGVPLLLLTADRPYESRDTGSNQSIDQVKMFSSSYIRWFRDIPSPSDDVPVSLALSDANHAVSLTKQLMGPVHLNIQFRENLAPDDGPIRNDNRIGSITRFHNARFIDVPGFARWSQSGSQWLVSYHSRNMFDFSVMEVAELILKSRRGIIVTGNLRSLDVDGCGTDYLSSSISYFAKTIGFPIFAGVQSGSLRRESSVIQYAEHVLKHPVVSKEIQPDLILQLGTPLVSTEVAGMISKSMKLNTSTKHVLVQQFYPSERADPDQTVTHRVSTNIGHFLKSVIRYVKSLESTSNILGSELAPVLYLGREMRSEMPKIIQGVAPYSATKSRDLETNLINGKSEQNSDVDSILTEPQIMLALTEVLAEASPSNLPMALFLSNSMPVRDGEFFLYPSTSSSVASFSTANDDKKFPISVSVNRGASGIDGIISTAIGCGDSLNPTTLICGDVTTLHDLNALYGLTTESNPNSSNLNRIPLTTVIVNNGGGAIFSFLPIAKHGQDVGFDEYWGTPTNKFSFSQGASAFGIPYKLASSFESFKDAYRSSIQSGAPVIIEAKVTSRSTNVDVHQMINRSAVDFIDKIISTIDNTKSNRMKLPIKQYNRETLQSSMADSRGRTKNLLLLHGWMGDKTDWDSVASVLSADLSDEWNLVAIDLPGHGDAPEILSSHQQIIRASLRLDSADPHENGHPFTLDDMARTICQSLIEDHQIENVDAIVGYSLGGRIALAMKRLCVGLDVQEGASIIKNGVTDISKSNLITDQTRFVLLGADPGKLPSENGSISGYDKKRVSKDFSLAKSLVLSSFMSYLTDENQDEQYLTRFLTKWYSSKQLWGSLHYREPEKYAIMMSKRLESLKRRRRDFAAVLNGCSPPRSSQNDWKTVIPLKTAFIAGALDIKYSKIGRRWQEIRGISKYIEVPNAGHALLVENPMMIAGIVSGFIENETFVDEHFIPADSFVTPGAATMTQSDKVQRSGRSTSRLHNIGPMEYESFGITIVSADGTDKGILGVGWGDHARSRNELKRREGFIISITSSDGMAVGIGEVSPLAGLHRESLADAELQLRTIKTFLSAGRIEASFCAEDILSLDGSLTKFIDQILISGGIKRDLVAPSVRSGLEMALLSVASQIAGAPLPEALAQNYFSGMKIWPVSPFGLLPINGLIPRGSASQQTGIIKFASIKVKIGDKYPSVDVENLANVKKTSGGGNLKLRADANRAWTLQSAQAFADEMQNIDVDILSALEFIEEPLEKQYTNGQWSLETQVSSLEDFTRLSRIRYALDESLVDLAETHRYNFEPIAVDLRQTFERTSRIPSGCAAFVLKPAMLGLELSMQIAKLAIQYFQIPVIFSSSFDSGIGLSYTSILAAVSDNSPFAAGLTKYSHGLGTFAMLAGDTLSPPFRSYMSEDGMLDVASLSKALYGLSLDEMSDRLPTYEASPTIKPSIASSKSESYLATTSSATGRDITVSVSMPLPFSDSIASSRFTDLPQMSRWSPWLNSVTYLDAAGLTEWNLNIKGVKFSWKALSEVVQNPRGIKWKSISGLRNSGVVEFEPVSADSCLMKLKMSIIMPYVLVSLFQGMPSVVHDFLQNKLLKWSLEMFRDVVKADLALERGDNELGDALFGAVEGRANALEEALK